MSAPGVGTEMRRGTAAALGAAALFGVSAPAAKVLLTRVEPLLLGALLYLGAGLGLTVLRATAGGRRGEAALRRDDVPLLLAMTAAGGVVAPLLLLVGLRRMTAVGGSLLLNLEGPCTVLLAVAVFGEHLGARAAIGAATMMLGAATLGLTRSAVHAGDGAGVLAIAAACVAWAIDNNLTQRLSLRDPLAVAQAKGLLGGGVALVLALIVGFEPPAVGVVGSAAAVGFVSYGLSLACAVYAMRAIGAAREAALFTTAPFMGALASVVLLHEPLGARELIAALLMVIGLGLLAGARHSHRHAHEALRHDHRHVHDVHHRHAHTTADPPGEPHAHEHVHAALEHEHPHVSDEHHRHH
jgi:drug/metabolite transporter (DMT)-like permease